MPSGARGPSLAQYRFYVTILSCTSVRIQLGSLRIFAPTKTTRYTVAN